MSDIKEIMGQLQEEESIDIKEFLFKIVISLEVVFCFLE